VGWTWLLTRLLLLQLLLALLGLQTPKGRLADMVGQQPMGWPLLQEARCPLLLLLLLLLELLAALKLLGAVGSGVPACCALPPGYWRGLLGWLEQQRAPLDSDVDSWSDP
jgi:hypothetical protein